MPSLSSSPSASVAGAKAVLARSITAFFYLWYGIPEHNGRWLHWDHFTLPHWTAAVNQQHEATINKYRRPDLGACVVDNVELASFQ